MKIRIKGVPNIIYGDEFDTELENCIYVHFHYFEQFTQYEDMISISLIEFKFKYKKFITISEDSESVTWVLSEDLSKVENINHMIKSQNYYS